jgi:hypothetical protein
VKVWVLGSLEHGKIRCGNRCVLDTAFALGCKFERERKRLACALARMFTLSQMAAVPKETCRHRQHEFTRNRKCKKLAGGVSPRGRQLWRPPLPSFYINATHPIGVTPILAHTSYLTLLFPTSSSSYFPFPIYLSSCPGRTPAEPPGSSSPTRVIF